MMNSCTALSHLGYESSLFLVYLCSILYPLVSMGKTLYIQDLGFPGSSAGKESTCNAGDPGSITGLGRSNGEGIGYPLQYSGWENSIDYTVHGVTKNRT